MSGILGTSGDAQFIGIGFSFIDTNYFRTASVYLDVYMIIRRYVWRKETGPLGRQFAKGRLFCKFTRDELAQKTGIKPTRLKRAIWALEMNGWIKQVTVGNDKTKHILVGHRAKDRKGSFGGETFLAEAIIEQAIEAERRIEEGRDAVRPEFQTWTRKRYRSSGRVREQEVTSDPDIEVTSDPDIEVTSDPHMRSLVTPSCTNIEGIEKGNTEAPYGACETLSGFTHVQSALGRSSSPAPFGASSDSLEDDGENFEGRSCVPPATTDAPNPHLHEDQVEHEDQESLKMPETPEQKRQREENYRKLRGGKPPAPFTPNRTRGDETKRQPSEMGGSFKLFSRPPSKKSAKAVADARLLEEELNKLVPDPDTVSAAPTGVQAFYAHFKKVVKKRWPDAKLDDLYDANNQPIPYLWKQVETVLSRNSPEDNYEMIRLLVLDYENFKHARVFMKYYEGVAHPYFEQLYANSGLLKTFIGRGVVSPPTVRVSNYYEDYQRRHSGGALGAPPEAPKPIDGPVDPIADLRRRYSS